MKERKQEKAMSPLRGANEAPVVPGVGHLPYCMPRLGVHVIVLEGGIADGSSTLKSSRGENFTVDPWGDGGETTIGSDVELL